MSSIVLNNVTVIDHAYINNDGTIIGGSFQSSFHVSGKIDEKEKVVVDFSTIKKQLKEAIDSKINGFDHKLWFIEGFSHIVNTNTTNTTDTTISIDNEKITLLAATDSIKTIKSLPILKPEYSIFYIEAALSEFLLEQLTPIFPDIDLSISVILTTEATVTNLPDLISIKPAYFRYVHGLKDSTSWGCQNIAHGHLSFITAYAENYISESGVDDLTHYVKEIANEIDNVVFINKQNIVTDNYQRVVIGYNTPARGTFEMGINRNHTHCITLSTETTIEYIVEFVKTTYGEKLRNLGAVKLLVSEGLTKGAIVDL